MAHGLKHNEIRMKLKTINNQQNLGNQKHKTLTCEGVKLIQQHSGAHTQKQRTYWEILEFRTIVFLC